MSELLFLLFLFFFSRFVDLEAVHEPSERLEKFMPHAHEHVNTVKLLEELRRDNISMYLFSNAPGK